MLFRIVIVGFLCCAEMIIYCHVCLSVMSTDFVRLNVHGNTTPPSCYLLCCFSIVMFSLIATCITGSFWFIRVTLDLFSSVSIAVPGSLGFTLILSEMKVKDHSHCARIRIAEAHGMYEIQ